MYDFYCIRWQNINCEFKMDVHIHLPYSNHSIGDKDEENDQRLDKGSDGFLTFLKQGQYLMNRERESWSVRETSKI